MLIWVLIDFPLKTISYVIFLILGILLSVFYPLTKTWRFPWWICGWYNYATTKKLTFSKIKKI